MKKTSGFIIFFIILGVMWGNAFAGQDVKVDDNPNVSNRSKEKHIEPLLFPIKFYRDYISVLTGIVVRCIRHVRNTASRRSKNMVTSWDGSCARTASCVAVEMRQNYRVRSG